MRMKPAYSGHFLLLAMFCHSVVSPLWACDAIIVGRAASADGSVIVGHNEENALDRVLEFHKIPRQQHPAGSVVRLQFGGQIEEVPETLSFLWSENPELSYSDGYLNECGVAIVSVKCVTREDSYETLVSRGEIRNGGIGYMLRRLVALRAKTARDGVELMGRLIEQFGYADSGRSYVVADPIEAWLIEVARGRRWVAQRVPDSKVVFLPARHIIGEVDLADRDNFRASPDLINYAVARGWFDPSKGEAFNFRKVYQTPEATDPDRRHFRAQELITSKAGNWPPREPIPFAHTPHKKFAVRDVIASLRDDKGIASIFNKSTQEAAVFQLRDKMPREVGCIYWRTTGRPDISVLTPWYVGVTSTPDNYGRRVDPATLLSLDHHFKPPTGTFDPDSGRAWWKFKTLAKLVDEDYVHRIKSIQTAWSLLEDRAFTRQPSLETEALKLWPKAPAEARAALTRYCAEIAAEACAKADELSAGLGAGQKDVRRSKSERYEKAILAFEAADKKNPPPQNAILFTGASNIVGWKTLAQDFPEYKVINRGFGGSHIADCVFYADRIVIPYRPRVIVFRTGGNDIQSGKSPEEVAADFKAFAEKVHAKLPDTRIVYWPMTPSVARLANWNRENKGNQLIKAYINAGKNMVYIDAAEATLGPDGKPRAELFKKDGLHFNDAAYKMFTPIIRPYLK
ncbi:MAG: C69 family dipeptidase [Verrucomicrobiia bacterium]